MKTDASEPPSLSLTFPLVALFRWSERLVQVDQLVERYRKALEEIDKSFPVSSGGK